MFRARITKVFFCLQCRLYENHTLFCMIFIHFWERDTWKGTKSSNFHRKEMLWKLWNQRNCQCNHELKCRFATICSCSAVQGSELISLAIWLSSRHCWCVKRRFPMWCDKVRGLISREKTISTCIKNSSGDLYIEGKPFSKITIRGCLASNAERVISFSPTSSPLPSTNSRIGCSKSLWWFFLWQT